MRVKMRCPDCGSWFSLHVGVEGGRGDEKHEHVKEEAPAAAPAPKSGIERPSISAPAGNVRWIVAVCAVVAIVIVGLFVVRPMLSRQDATPVLQESTASPAAVEVEQPDAETPPADVEEETGAEGEGEAGAASNPPTESATETASETAMAPTPETATGPELERVGLAPGTLELTVVASERCWVQVLADGRVAGDLTLEAGERRTWQAEDFFELSVGAGDAVELYLNGESLGSAGNGPRVVERLRVTETGLVRGDPGGSL